MDYDYFYPVQGQTMTVHEDEKSPQDSGLLDQNGNSLFRNPKQHRIGFALQPVSMAKKKGKGGRKC